MPIFAATVPADKSLGSTSYSRNSYFIPSLSRTRTAFVLTTECGLILMSVSWMRVSSRRIQGPYVRQFGSFLFARHPSAMIVFLFRYQQPAYSSILPLSSGIKNKVAMMSSA